MSLYLYVVGMLVSGLYYKRVLTAEAYAMWFIPVMIVAWFVVIPVAIILGMIVNMQRKER